MSEPVIIGRATLYNADCRDVLPVLSEVGAGRDVVRHKHKASASAWDDAAPDAELLLACVAKAASAIVWGGNYFGLPPAQCFLVWDKVQPQDFSLAMCGQAWTNLKLPAKLYRQRVTGYSKEHPTQKPVRLMRWCLDFLPDAQTILDPFAGSGTTGVAAIQAGKSFVGVEREEGYFAAMCRRIREANGDDVGPLFGEAA